MNVEMKAAIEKAISENLTGAMAGELKSFLLDAEKTKEAHTKLLGEHDRVKAELAEVRKEVRNQQEVQQQIAHIMTKEADLAKRELQLAHDTAANAVLVAQAELKGYKEVTGLVFRNIAIHNAVNRNVGVPVTGAPSGNGYGGPGFVIQTDEREATTTTQG